MVEGQIGGDDLDMLCPVRWEQREALGRGDTLVEALPSIPVALGSDQYDDTGECEFFTPTKQLPKNHFAEKARDTGQNNHRVGSHALGGLE